ncbi:salt stress protein, Slr1339 family [Floridanema evergladense]|uniref:Salt stress protein, Slr1339 family n=1 Tax=Floridaenema evergladense BLCC-F167 TaxID=3153639 RepID=A0ABV4WFW6_9CYAN
MESIDDILAQLKSEYQEKDNPGQQKKQPSVKREDAIAPKTPPPTSRQKSFSPSSPEDALLSQIQAEFAEQDKAEELKRQEQIKEEKIRQERIKQQERQALTKEAEAWLKKLNPRSSEGLWFEEFAYSYSSKLEAAIDYLQALKETQS